MKNKLIVINNGISTERFKFDKSTRTRIRKQLGISEDCVLLGHVGRFTSEKNQSFLIQVLSQIPNKCNMQLLLIGEGPLVKDVMQLAKEKGIYKKIIQIEGQMLFMTICRQWIFFYFRQHMKVLVWSQ